MNRFGGFYSGLLKERRAVSALLLIFALSLISAALHFLLFGNAKNGGVALLLLLILLYFPLLVYLNLLLLNCFSNILQNFYI